MHVIVSTDSIGHPQTFAKSTPPASNSLSSSVKAGSSDGGSQCGDVSRRPASECGSAATSTLTSHQPYGPSAVVATYQYQQDCSEQQILPANTWNNTQHLHFSGSSGGSYYAPQPFHGELQQQQEYGYTQPIATGNNAVVPEVMPSVTIGHQTKLAAPGLSIRVGGKALHSNNGTPTTSASASGVASTVPSPKFTTSRATALMAMPKGDRRRNSETSSTSDVLSNSTGAASSNASNLSISDQLKATRDKQRDRNPGTRGSKRNANGERVRADEGPIPTCDFISRKTPFFIPANTPVVVCSSRDGVWRSGFFWRDNTRRVTISSLSDDDTEGPTFMRTADIALFDARGCPCDLDALTTRPCYVKIDKNAIQDGSADLYWNQNNGIGGSDFNAVKPAALNHQLRHPQPQPQAPAQQQQYQQHYQAAPLFHHVPGSQAPVALI